jgi:hypothetical protein
MTEPAGRIETLSQTSLPTSPFRDKLILVGSAIAVCVIGVSAFLFADNYRVNPVWLFFALNSLGFMAVVGRKFRSYSKTLPFISFFAVWLVVHAAVMIALTGWLPLAFWLPLIGLELFAGYLAAYHFFGPPPAGKR